MREPRIGHIDFLTHILCPDLSLVGESSISKVFAWIHVDYLPSTTSVTLPSKRMIRYPWATGNLMLSYFFAAGRNISKKGPGLVSAQVGLFSGRTNKDDDDDDDDHDDNHDDDDHDDDDDGHLMSKNTIRLDLISAKVFFFFLLRVGWGAYYPEDYFRKFYIPMNEKFSWPE